MTDDLISRAAAIAACEEQEQSWEDHKIGAAACAEAIRAIPARRHDMPPRQLRADRARGRDRYPVSDPVGGNVMPDNDDFERDPLETAARALLDATEQLRLAREEKERAHNYYLKAREMVSDRQADMDAALGHYTSNAEPGTRWNPGVIKSAQPTDAARWTPKSIYIDNSGWSE